MLVVRMEECATGDGIRCCGLWWDRVGVPEEEGDTNASDGGVRLRLLLPPLALLPASEEVPNCSCREGIPAAHVEVQAYATRKYME